MEIFKKIIKQTSWQLLGKAVTSLSSILILGFITRSYGQSGTGIATLAVTYLNIFYLLVDFGFNAHQLKTYEKSGGNSQIEWRKLFGTRLVWAIFLAIIAVGLLPFWPFGNFDFNLSILIGSLAIIAFSVYITTNLFFQHKLKYQFSVAASVLGMLLNLLLVFIFTFYQLPIPFILLAYTAGWVLIASVSLLFGLILHEGGLPIFDLRFMKILFKQSWPIAATLALNVVYFRADSFLIASYNGLSDAGIYNVAYSIFQTALVLPSFIMNSYYPLMLKSFKGIKLVATGLIGLSLIGTALTWVLAPSLIILLTGKGFNGSVTSLQILSLGFPAYFSSALLMWVLVTKNQYKKMLLIYFLGLVFNLVLNFLYIPQYSYTAASLTTVISEYLILMMLAVSLLW